MNDYHRLLLRQLKRSGIDITKPDFPTQYQELLKHVSNAYHEADESRYIIERSMEISSQEMLQLRDTLQKEKEIMQAVISEGMCVIDPFWKITNINLTGGKLLCCEIEKVLNKFFFDVFTLYCNHNGNETEIDLPFLREKCKNGEIYHCEMGELKSFKGITRPVSFSINPMPLINNTLFGGAVFIFRDITERIKTEQILITSLHAAEQSNKAKTQFLANMSHEIRTPMNGILGMLQLLMYTSLDETQKNYANKCFESANSLLRIIGDILDFSKIDAGMIDIEELEFNLKNEFETMMIIFTTMSKEKSIDVNLQYDSNLPNFVIGDAFRMKQIINNLMNNAIKFTPNNGEIEVSVKAQEINHNSLVLSISIADTGIGIPPNMQEKIFDVFAQADESTTRKYGGTGLGLAICKHLVEHMGGQINLKSEEGKGSTFNFTMKMRIPENQSQSISETSTLPTIPKFKANILIVEDNSLNQTVVKDMLNTLGCHIDIVSSGKEAINAVQHQKYDVILMDCHMPDMDGFQTTEKIRQIENEHSSSISKNSIIVALTANTLKGTKERCLAVGMDDYLSKPINYSQLCSTLVKHLSYIQRHR
ncbi:MAG: response regulator [Gammaproteobacteria bacterium]|jgi:signal transduction histidine kinase/ActR/RegA family two-component response regulator|nr:response regulator [Gammaproteobacteria bacterium]